MSGDVWCRSSAVEGALLGFPCVCVCVCVCMDAPRDACGKVRVGKEGHVGCGLREGFASPRVVACASLPPGLCATVLIGTRY